MLAVIVALNLTAWISPTFCDWYTAYIFQIWVGIFARFMNIFPFSVGEILIVIAVILALTAVILGILCIFLRVRKGFVEKVLRFYKLLSIICVNAGLIVTFNYSILYHCNRIDPNEYKENRQYTVSELEILRNFIVEKCNYYAMIMERDASGDIIYNGDMQETAKEALRGLSEEYPRLAGYYPDVKIIHFSNLMSQAYIAGVYFSFSMEANCNGNMYIANYPTTYCHELAHMQGYSFEDEAEFLSYMACVNSEDEFFKYSGYLEAFAYVQMAYQESLDYGNGELDWDRYHNQPVCLDYVLTDGVFLKQEMWEEVENSAIVSTDVVSEISHTMNDMSIKANGVEEGAASYDGLVELLLQYYDGILY